MSVSFRSGCALRLGWTEQRERFLNSSDLPLPPSAAHAPLCSGRQLICFLRQMNCVCIAFCCLDRRSQVTSRAGRWGWQQGSSLSTWILLHIIAVALGDWQNSEDVTVEATTCRTQQVWLHLRNLPLWTAKYYRVNTFFPDPSFPRVLP